MARGSIESLDSEARRLIEDAMRQKKLNPSRLAALVEVNRSTIGRIIAGQKGATASTLQRIAEILEIAPAKLRVQYELAFEIDDDFAAVAKQSLIDELARLRKEVGRIRAIRVTGSVGVRFHGFAPEQRVFERVFAIPISATRGRRRAASA